MTREHKAEFFLLLTTVIYGSTFVIAKALLDEASPLLYTGARFLLAALIVLVLFNKRVWKIPRSTIVKGSVLGILLFLGFASQTIGLQFTTASKSAFFTGMLVVFTPVVYFFIQNLLNLERKPLRYGNILGVFLSACGLYLLTAPSGGKFNVGDAMTLGCALFFAIYIVYLDFASKEPDKLQLTYVQFVLCGIFGLISALFFEEMRMEFTANFMASVLYLTIFATIISMWIQNQYQGDTTPTRAAVIFSLEPVIAGIFAYLVSGENIGTLGILGGAVVLSGLLMSELSDGIPGLKKNVLGETERAG